MVNPTRKIGASNKCLLILCFLSVLPKLSLAFGMDSELLENIKNWNKGDEPPAKLLSFPDGKTEKFADCSFSNYGNHISDYLQETENLDLLESLLFDDHADGNAVKFSASRMIALRGVGYLAEVIEKNWEMKPMPRHPELCVLRQLLMAPYVSLRVARFEKDVLESKEALIALKKMELDLSSGMDWDKAYRKFADLYPDKRPSKDGQTGRTLLCYAFAGEISASGFVLGTQTISEEMPKKDLESMLSTKKQTYVTENGQGVFLYYADSYFPGLKP